MLVDTDSHRIKYEKDRQTINIKNEIDSAQTVL